MALKTLLVMPILDATWRRDFELSIPPFVGLGIRLDVYDMVNVDSVVVGDFGYDVTCIVSVEGAKPDEVTEKLLTRLGFERGVYV
jgi:hypothetical protein